VQIGPLLRRVHFGSAHGGMGDPNVVAARARAMSVCFMVVVVPVRDRNWEDFQKIWTLD
jgi:hypothetical protein